MVSSSTPTLLPGTPITHPSYGSGTVRRVRLEDGSVRIRLHTGQKIWIPAADVQRCTVQAQQLSMLPDPVPAVSATPTGSAFDVHVRFEFLSQASCMVAEGKLVSMLCTGEGGLGKSYTVMQAVKSLHMQEEIDYKLVKGTCTARALYEILHDNSSKLLIFDDCDSVLDDDRATMILKAALDSYDTRNVTWATSAQRSTEDYETSFEFTGAIIFISNKRAEEIPQSLRSRSICIDVSMTMDEKLSRMERILPHVAEHVSLAQRREAFEVLKKHAARARELSLRTLLKTIAIRHASSDEGWEKLAEYVIVN